MVRKWSLLLAGVHLDGDFKSTLWERYLGMTAEAGQVHRRLRLHGALPVSDTASSGGMLHAGFLMQQLSASNCQIDAS